MNKYKELMSNEVKPLEYDEHANIIAKRRVAGGRKFVNLSTTAFNGRKVDAEVPDIFDKRKCFRQMSAFRINYLCRYFKIINESDLDVIMPYIIKSYEISKYNPVDLKNNFIELYYSE